MHILHAQKDSFLPKESTSWHTDSTLGRNESKLRKQTAREAPLKHKQDILHWLGIKWETE